MVARKSLTGNLFGISLLLAPTKALIGPLICFVYFFHLYLYLSLLFAVVLCVSEEEWVGGGTRLFYDNHKSQRAPPGPTAAFSLFSTFMPYLPHSFIT